jgi:hypothetical protein
VVGHKKSVASGRFGEANFVSARRTPSAWLTAQRQKVPPWFRHSQGDRLRLGAMAGAHALHRVRGIDKWLWFVEAHFR